MSGTLTAAKAGDRLLLMGNEAIARGALEAGVDFCAAYPGSPASEIIGTLATEARDGQFYVEWSTNEIVALEGAAAASFAGLRSLSALKHNGMCVASDFITTLSFSGTRGGYVLVVADDIHGHSSTNEVDTRYIVRMANLPLLEPSTAQEAKDMTRWAFELSEQIGLMCIVRCTTRLSHARGNVVADEIRRTSRRADFTSGTRFTATPVLVNHQQILQKMARATQICANSPFNGYDGPADAEYLVVASGIGAAYAQEAIQTLSLGDKVGLLKIGISWPLPEALLVHHLAHAKAALMVDEGDPFLEENVKVIAAEHLETTGGVRFYGKRDGTIPMPGELSPDVLVDALVHMTGMALPQRDSAFAAASIEFAQTELPVREIAMCAGCPHHVSYWVMKNALALDGRDGVIVGDIGCYGMGFGRSGYNSMQTIHCMGAGVGIASGLGNLDLYDFDRPVIALSGDSTFFHATLPGLVNGRYNQSSFVLAVLDNSATSMTGFQPHPGTGRNACGDPVPPIKIEDVTRGLGVETIICDPFDVEGSIDSLYQLLQGEGPRVIVFRRKCALVERVGAKVWVDQSRCIGDECGCGRFCVATFGCPALVWDQAAGRARIDDVVCTGCCVCAGLCPEKAILTRR